MDSKELDAFGFSKYDKKVVTIAWEMVKRDLERCGVNILIMYFTEYPEHARYFDFKQYDPLHLDENPQVRFHANRVLRTLSYWIDHINEAELVTAEIQDHIDKHVSRNISPKAYDDLRRAVLKFMLKQFEDKFTMDMAECMNKVLETVFHAITTNAFCICPECPGPSD